MTFGRHWLITAAVVPLLLLGACSQDDPQPKFSPPSESPTAAESSPAEPVVRPWEKKTEAGAVAFAKHWIDVFSDAMLSGDTDGIVELSARNCRTCANVTDHLDEVYSDGGAYRKAKWSVTSADASVRHDAATVAMVIRRSAESFRESSSSPWIGNPGSSASFSAIVRWTLDRWVMQRLDFVG